MEIFACINRTQFEYSVSIYHLKSVYTIKCIINVAFLWHNKCCVQISYSYAYIYYMYWLLLEVFENTVSTCIGCNTSLKYDVWGAECV